METLSGAYGGLIKTICSGSNVATHVTPDNVYQLGNKSLLPHIDRVLGDLVLDASGFSGTEHILELWKKSQEGAACLILPEHYSNTDLPCFSYLLRKELPQGEEIVENVVAIAGKKLNEDNPAVAAFASAYSRIVICPSRELPLVNGKKDEEERLRVIQINRAAMHTLNRVKRERKMVLVFPAGTRFRPWDPASKRGVREIDSYVKGFDYMCLVAINGSVLKIRKGDMLDDYVDKDVVHFTASPVVSCAAFRAKAKEAAEKCGARDVKQAVVDALMAELDSMHNAVEPERQKLLS
ncbi:MAG: 1-acyl-sn-glycerol-3-phosphate acyltransferase [Spirochaetaceae bacterium]|jgi:glycerol-3-phosphate O-acyltransferase|nr:1-acyl-sn-glycerol-3-phosphate acyltransferase [Spirochaetaceae bacterium]